MSYEPHDDLPSTPATPAQKRLGKYELIKPLGRGGMGEVWLANDTVADVQVALKMLPAELRLNDEAQDQIRVSYQRVHKLSHPSICGVKDLVLQAGTGFFLVMDYFDGITLSKFRLEYVKQNGAFPLNVALRLLAPVAQALDHAHKVGLAHRDVKPGNILVSRDGKEVRVIDFQLASEIRSSVSRFTKIAVDTSGTYPYMAPEQFLGSRANAKTDLYSLAMVAYELLAGELPFEPRSWDQWKSLVTDASVKVPAIAGLAQPVQQALAKGMSLDPSARPASCVAYLQGVKNALQGANAGVAEPIFDPVPPPSPKPAGPSGKEKTVPVPPQHRTTSENPWRVAGVLFRSAVLRWGLLVGGASSLLVLLLVVIVSVNNRSRTVLDSISKNSTSSNATNNHMDYAPVPPVTPHAAQAVTEAPAPPAAPSPVHIPTPREIAEEKYRLAIKHIEGDSVAVDLPKAIKLLTEASDQRYAMASFRLGDIYRDGTGTNKSYSDAVKYYELGQQQSIEGIDIYLTHTSFYHLAEMYREGGHGIASNPFKAINSYRKVGETGIFADLALCNMAEMHMNGEGVLRDPLEGIKCYESAASLGYENAKYKLAVIYRDGDGVPKSRELAAKWFKSILDGATEENFYTQSARKYLASN